MPSAYARQVPEATLLEKAGPKGYIRLMFPLELPDGYVMEECFAIFQAGFQATQERIPSLKCEGVPDTEAKQAGVLRLRVAHDLEAFVCQDLVMKPSGRNAGRVEDHDEYVVLPFTPEGMPEKMLSREHAGQVFTFSAESLARLKADVAPANATQPTDVPWISTTDALTALMWRSVLAAQIAPEEVEGDPVSIASLAADARLGRTDPPVHPRTLGNWLCWRQATFPVRAILASASLADLACAVRQATTKLNDQWADDLIAMFAGVEDVNRVVATAFLDVPGKCFVQTTWSQLTVCDLAWGPKLGERIRAVRSPDIGIINGGSVVLPPLPDGGMECILGVEAKSLARLLGDPVLANYAIPITL